MKRGGKGGGGGGYAAPIIQYHPVPGMNDSMRCNFAQENDVIFKFFLMLSGAQAASAANAAVYIISTFFRL